MNDLLLIASVALFIVFLLLAAGVLGKLDDEPADEWDDER